METISTVKPAAPPLQRETTAGNYFVSNYPPFSFWKAENAIAAIDALERQPDAATPLGVYMHIPFCRKRCHFCYFRVYTDKDSREIRSYLDAAIAEFRMYSQMPFIGNRKPEFVYFGGGTPSYLSVDQLRHLTDQMKSLLPWDAVKEVTFECEPGTLNEAKLKAIHEMGVTRLSLGIENFSDRILEINGRAHRSNEIMRAYSYARSLNFPQINIDLIAGMVEETEENWRDCVQRTLELQPDSVTIYQMEVPYNTTIYKQMKAAGQLQAPVADWDTKRAWVDFAFSELERQGYTIASGYTAVKDPQAQFVYRDRLWQGADLLGLGVASFSHIGGVHFQNLHDFDPYLQKLQSGQLPIYRAFTPTQKERLVREMILQLKRGNISRQYFLNKFQVDITAEFAATMEHLASNGFLKLDGDRISLTRTGLLQVDRLITEFYLPEHRNSRYA